MSTPVQTTVRSASRILERPGGRWARGGPATEHKIVRTGRRLLAEQGAEAVTLRAIARTLGLSTPALYRYFDGRGDLLRTIAADVAASLTGELRAAVGRLPDRDLSRVFVVAGFALRNWALAHQHEYRLIFTVPPVGAEESDEVLGAAFLGLVLSHWEHPPFPVPADEEVASTLRGQLLRHRRRFGDQRLPLGAVRTLLDCWVRLQGFVASEVFGHMAFALDDATPLFELMLADIAHCLSQSSCWRSGGAGRSD